MQDFMMIFRYEPKPGFKPTPEQINEQAQKWQRFIGGLVAQKKFVSTSQLGFQGKVLHVGNNVTNGTYAADSKIVGGNMVVKANSLEEAVELSKESPILALGGSVEVRDILPMNR